MTGNRLYLVTIIWSSFCDSPDPSLLVFLFFTDASGRKVEDHRCAGWGPVLNSVSRGIPFALKSLSVRELSSGVGAMVPQYESPARILVKRR